MPLSSWSAMWHAYSYDASGRLSTDYEQYYLGRWKGVRTSDPTIGQWNAPDAYAGDVHDPMSQKPYMWNQNNPYAYSDPSGYMVAGVCAGSSAATCGAVAARILTAAVEGAAAAAIVVVGTLSLSGDEPHPDSGKGDGKGPDHPTLQPGPHAGEGVPGQRGARPTSEQQGEINKQGNQNGCHTCGVRDPGMRSGNWVGTISRLMRLILTQKQRFIRSACSAAAHKVES